MVRVLVVDDSPLVRRVLRAGLTAFADIEIVGEAGDGLQAIQMVDDLRPDVVTMDVFMPIMDGMEAIERIMSERPTPIVVVADAGGDAEALAIEGLGRGATHVFPKPVAGFDSKAAEALAHTIRRANQVRVTPLRPRAGSRRRIPTAHTRPRRGRRYVVGIAGSTGGPRVLQTLLMRLPPDFSHPLAIVQHTADGFTPALVAWLDAMTPLKVRLAVAGEVLEPGHVVVAPDNRHMRVERGRRIRLDDGPPVDGHRPSGSVLLESLAQTFLDSAVGVVLTGMGRDGARGIAAIDAAGGVAIVQDPVTATVGGMPRAALALTPEATVVDGDALAEQLSRLGRGAEP